MERTGILTKVKLKMDEVVPPGIDLPFDDIVGPILDECAKEIAMTAPLHLLSPVSEELPTFNDWFLPSRDELVLMFNNLHAYGFGGFALTNYHCSSEYDADHAWTVDFSDPDSISMGTITKSGVRPVRACHEVRGGDIYNLRDIGPAGGWIFYKVDNQDGTFTYLEVTPTDQSGGKAWSNIIDSAVTNTHIEVNEGPTNTQLIIAQAGHTDSAANLCNGVSITRSLLRDLIFVDDKCYIPKPSDFLRLYEIRFSDWSKSVRELIKPDTDAYKIQDNEYLKSGIGRPTVMLLTTVPTGGTLREWLVCGKVEASETPVFLYIKIPLPETLPDQLIDSLTWLCSSKVLQVSGRGDLAQGLMQQYQLLLTSLSKV